MSSCGVGRFKENQELSSRGTQTATGEIFAPVNLSLFDAFDSLDTLRMADLTG
jgi:hypothetical protein